MDSTKTTPLLERLVSLAAYGAVAVAVLLWVGYAAVSAGAATYQLIDPADPAVIPANKFAYSEEETGADADIIAIYGQASGEPEAFLFVADEDVIHPEEKPSLALLKKPESGQHISKAIVHFAVVRASIGAAAVALLLLGLRWFLRRRRMAA